MLQREPEPTDIQGWVEFMKVLLRDVVPGENYVYFDGYVIPTTAESITIEGWHSNHELSYVPQVAALIDPEIRDMLSSRRYWLANRIDQSDDESE